MGIRAQLADVHTRLRIQELKIQLRREYLRYTSDTGMTCGKELADHIQGFDRAGCRARCNELLGELRELDPAAAHFKDIA